uniref:Uncharacterized protein n=1 Tax=Anopheles maculatus TaxID=74869 RepID=A0A182SU36_9DIPT
MRKKFVQTLAAQQLELSSHIRTHDMELGKEPPRIPPQQRTSLLGNGLDDVIEIMDDEQEVELMMERHRKYHPRKYVNLQQPTSKVYYDKIDTSTSSPAQDKDDQDNEEDDDRLMVIDFPREATQTQEPNNNSVTKPNGNNIMLDSNGEPSGPTSFPSGANGPLSAHDSGFNWHVQPPNPYERQTNSTNTTTSPNYNSPQGEHQRNTATPHPQVLQAHGMAAAGGISSGVTLGDSAGDGRKSAFSTPHDKRQLDATLMPPPALVPGPVGGIAIAPRTPPFFHHPFIPPYHYPAYSANTPNASTFLALEEWYRAGFPAPHLLSPAQLQYYYHCYLNKVMLAAPPGYHPHDHQYRDYSAL